MQRLFNQLRRGTTILAAILAITAPAGAQRLIDLPVRAWAGADAVTGGAAAAFWNPAAAALVEGRAEATVFDLLAPDPTGLGAFAAAGAFRLDDRTAVAVGYHHVGVDGILQTTDSPIAEDATPLDVGEDAFALAASRSISPVLHTGIVVRYIRAAELAEDRSVVEFGAGMLARLPDLPGAPALGAAARAEADGVAWNLGGRATPFVVADSALAIGGSWGADGGPLRIGVSHRFAAEATWRDRVTVALGAASEPDADGRTWRPLGSASLRISRYSLAVLRENMANDFGAVHALRFSVAFE